MSETMGTWLQRGEEPTIVGEGVVTEKPSVAQPQRGPRSLVF